MALLSERRGRDNPDWKAINAAILDRWKPSGLEQIREDGLEARDPGAPRAPRADDGRLQCLTTLAPLARRRRRCGLPEHAGGCISAEGYAKAHPPQNRALRWASARRGGIELAMTLTMKPDTTSTDPLTAVTALAEKDRSGRPVASSSAGWQTERSRNTTTLHTGRSAGASRAIAWQRWSYIPSQSRDGDGLAPAPAPHMRSTCAHWRGRPSCRCAPSPGACY